MAGGHGLWAWRLAATYKQAMACGYDQETKPNACERRGKRRLDQEVELCKTEIEQRGNTVMRRSQFMAPK